MKLQRSLRGGFVGTSGTVSWLTTRTTGEAARGKVCHNTAVMGKDGKEQICLPSEGGEGLWRRCGSKRPHR